MRPLDFHDMGVRLAGSENEAEQRTAVSRLYYGLHHEAACRYFRENPDALPIPRNRRHAALRERFEGLDAPAGKDLRDLLDALSEMRGECDYRIGSPLRYDGGTMTLAQLLGLALDAAARLRATLDAYPPGESADGAEYRVTGD